MSLIEQEDDFVLVSVPVNIHGEITLGDLRDLLEATDSLPGTAVAVFLNDELRVETAR